MAVGYDSFLLRFPEFDGAPRSLVESCLVEAAGQIDTAVWRTHADAGVMYLAAHLLSMSSHGQHSRLVPSGAKASREDALTTYEREYRRLVRVVTSGFRVVGT